MIKKVDKKSLIDDIMSDCEDLNRATIKRVVDSFIKNLKKRILNGDEIVIWGLFSTSFKQIKNKNVSVKPGRTKERKVLSGITQPHIKLSKSIKQEWKKNNNK